MTTNDLNAKVIGARAKQIVDEYDGILPYYEVFYLLSLESEARSGLIAFDRFLSSVWKERDNITFEHFLDFLNHCAAISRLFWPPRPRQQELRQLVEARARTLRSAFSQTERSALKDRSLRNVAEHYDEYLDGFLLTEPLGPILPMPTITHEHLDEASVGHAFKFINPVYEYAVILGNRLDYKRMVESVQDVSFRSTKCLKDGSRLLRA